MQVNSISVNYKLVNSRRSNGLGQGAENPFATSRVTLQSEPSVSAPQQIMSSHLPAKKPDNMDIPEELSDLINEDILSSLFSP